MKKSQNMIIVPARAVYEAGIPYAPSITPIQPERDYYQIGEQQQICKDDTEQDRLPYRSEHTEAIFPYKRGKRAETGSKTSLFKEELISALRTTCPEAFQKTLWKLYPP